jgi:hypothetical protein
MRPQQLTIVEASPLNLFFIKYFVIYGDLFVTLIQRVINFYYSQILWIGETNNSAYLEIGFYFFLPQSSIFKFEILC